MERGRDAHAEHDCAASYRLAIDDAIGIVEAMNSRRGVNSPLLDALRRRLESLAIERREASGQ